ncbi:MAG: hypothetical protein CMJ48_07455 [Planctomycetaceae bacterium]|nr:hypothetical protein [Planctomycetaceae bacterium]
MNAKTHNQTSRTRGFTLVELLVAMTIMVLLTVITVAALDSVRDSDKERGASRSVQAMLEGARARAIYEKQSVGVRFLRDETDDRTSTSMVYIMQPKDFAEGQIRVVDTGGASPRPRQIQLGTLAPRWQTLRERKLLLDGARIKLESVWYTIVESPNGSNNWELTKDFLGAIDTDFRYVLKLYPTIKPNETPVELPANVAVNLHFNASEVPSSWTKLNSSGTAPANNSLDILFSPRGVITGSSRAQGTFHLVMSNTEDTTVGLPVVASNWLASTAASTGDWIRPAGGNGNYYRATSSGTTSGTEPSWPSEDGDTVTDGGVTWQCHIPGNRYVVSVFTQSGRVATAPINEQTNDAFQYAELGEDAK